jgi:hypothetical protein
MGGGAKAQEICLTDPNVLGSKLHILTFTLQTMLVIKPNSNPLTLSLAKGSPWE